MNKIKFMDAIIHLIPLFIRKKVYVYFQDYFMTHRMERELSIPKVSLMPKHIASCEILLNRQNMIRELPRNGFVAEIGVDRGDFSEEILSINRPKILHLVDLWEFKNYGHEKYEFVFNRFNEQILKGNVIIHKKLSLDAVNDFPDEYFDWIYIDTNHTYETTRKELNAYAVKIKPNGFLAGHDYTKGNFVKAIRVGVIEAVHEFCVENDWEIKYLTIDPIEIQSFVLRRIN